MSPPTPCFHCQRTPNTSEGLFPSSGCCIVRSYCSEKCHRADAANHIAASQAETAEAQAKKPAATTMKVDLNTFPQGGRPAGESERTIVFVETTKPHKNLIRKWGPYTPGDVVIANVRALLEFEHSHKGTKKFDDLLDFASIEGFEGLTAPLPCGHTITINISRELNTEVLTALRNHKSAVPLSLYHLWNESSQKSCTFMTKDAAYKSAREHLGDLKKSFIGSAQVEMTDGVLHAFISKRYAPSETILTVQPYPVQVDGSIFVPSGIKI